MPETAKPATRSRVVCCRQCGRDTRSRSGVCATCEGGGADEQRGRKPLRPWWHIGGDPFENVEDFAIGGPVLAAYHGPTIRDDL